MAPIAVDPPAAQQPSVSELKIAGLKLDAKNEAKGFTLPPPGAQERYRKAGIDISQGYPYYPPKPETVQKATEIRANLRKYVDPATRADPEKKALFGAAKEVKNLTTLIGTEIIGLQLADLNDKQRDELALLVAERGVVFFRDQELSPQKQREIGVYLGDGESRFILKLLKSQEWVEASLSFGTMGRTHSLEETLGTSTLRDGTAGTRISFTRPTLLLTLIFTKTRFPRSVATLSGVHCMEHTTSFRPNSRVSLRISEYFNDLLTSTQMRTTLMANPSTSFDPRQFATGWKHLYVNPSMTIGIEGFDKLESDAILKHIFNIAERSLHLQVRFHWTPGTSAVWDNRSVLHAVALDNEIGVNNRHGTTVSSLGEVPYFDPASKGRREALGLDA